jgi:hypothetical protein
VNVYVVVSVKPVIVQFVDEVEQVWPPLDVTVYSVIAEPPSDVGALQETTDCLLSFEVAETLRGTPGFVATTTTSGSEANSTVTWPS